MKVGILKLIKCSKERFKRPEHTLKLSVFLNEEEIRKREAFEEAIASVICIFIIGAIYFFWMLFV